MTTRASSSEAIHFRMPRQLRARLRAFAEERSLGEAEALRLALAERFNELDDERELAAAERWQFKQAYATWQRLRDRRERVVDASEVRRVFDKVLKRKPRRRAAT